MECTVHWVAGAGMAFLAETGSGHTLTMDGAPDGGGRNLAPRPMETLLAGAGGCAAYDVVVILRKGSTAARISLRARRRTSSLSAVARLVMVLILHFSCARRNYPPWVTQYPPPSFAYSEGV